MGVKCWLSAAGLVVAVCTSTATGTPINQTLPLFTSDSSSTGFPIRFDVGTFSSIPLGESLISGSISGTFGNLASAGGGSIIELYLGDGGDLANDVLLADCPLGNCFSLTTPWTHPFTDADLGRLSLFTGPLTFTALQMSQSQVRLGPTTLIAVSEGSTPVPEPGTLALVGSALILFAAVQRRRRPA